MPFCEADPWRLQYFAHVECPREVRIPTEDPDAYEWYPAHRSVYNKLTLAASQGLSCAPHGVAPPAFPVFSKPIMNLRGMGVGSRVLHDSADYERHRTPGHFWMTLLEGEHVSTDLAVQDGAVRWLRHSLGRATRGGMFDYWTIEAARRAPLEHYLRDWVARALGGYTGMLNLETIDGRIIDAHLRFADQWPDLYGPGWLQSVVGLYQHGVWEYEDAERRDGYSVALFGAHGRSYQHPPPTLVAALRSAPQVCSVQITFHSDRPPAAQPMPPGGFRLAVVNCLELAAGRAARARLAQFFAV